MAPPSMNAEERAEILFQKISTALVAMAMVVFISNFYHSYQLYRRNRQPIYTLCLVQSAIGCFCMIINVIMDFTLNFLCNFRVYSSACLYMVSFICIELILLMKAYYCNNRAKSVLIPGCCFLTICFGCSIWNLCTIRVTDTAAIHLYENAPALMSCSVHVENVAIIALIIADNLLNFYLTVCFLSNIYRSYKFNRSNLFATLLRDGTLYSLVTSTSSVLIVTVTVTNVLGTRSSTLFAASCK
ncbi:hypothetical protein K493DRAFT_18113 [Basidiobolus meristosporus CBS 931.73]|uniref:G-protein coupled receptors family 1 profile domain-containing protein n=1 Tax=Basidiobolus meristosporus CBS 931.73 TaxID=1314790 RepID=A0A1Y1Z8F0_9FUNG|nr:hypothetical protein K493DRAFT_18113 [Basidiobolus meristosporus CBS 931.73]|eukprot:ORY06550.1 hypothetical protein K493DRAFT_18113 [Basidiobolus meristosporus CBS 931.73]